MKVLYLDHADIMGGAEWSLLHLIRWAEGIEPVVACLPDGLLAQALSVHRIRTVPLDLGELRGAKHPLAAGWNLGRGMLSLLRLIRREKVDWVHTNTMRVAIYGALAARLAGVPCLWHVRDIYGKGRVERFYVALMGRLAHRIVAISQAVAAPLPPWAAQKVRIVHNGVDLTAFAPSQVNRQDARRALGLPAQGLVVGNVAWLAPWKGQHRFLEGVARLSHRFPTTVFAIIGEAAHPSYADYVEGLRQQAAPLADRVRFLRRQGDMPQAMAALDLLVHTAEAEPFGRVLIEAMAMGLPVVAFSDGGVPEIVADGVTGFLVPPGDLDALAEAMATLLADAALRRRMGEAARARVEAHFSVQWVAREITDIYRAGTSQRL